MAKQPETLFKEKVKSALAAIPNSWFEKIAQKSIRGTPDFIGCIDGQFIALELKKDLRSKPDPLQEYKLSQIAESGGVAFVVSPENMKETIAYLLQLSNGGKIPEKH